MRVPSKWFVEPVAVETYGGQSSFGPDLAPSRPVNGNVRAERKLVLTSTGASLNAEWTLRFPPSAHGMFTPQSKVTFHGRTALVLTVKPYTLRGRLVYIEVTTT